MLDALNGGTDDPQHFADAVTTLHDDPETWNTLRRGAIASLIRDNNQTHYIDSLQGILKEMARADARYEIAS